jgi:hypothetical protein
LHVSDGMTGVKDNQTKWREQVKMMEDQRIPAGK